MRDAMNDLMTDVLCCLFVKWFSLLELYFGRGGLYVLDVTSE